MKLPKTDNAEKYVGLYVIDFQGQCGIGYVAEEVATLLESERFAEVKVYKIHRAQPDGTMELAGVSREKFVLESGMFFHCRDENSGRRDFQALCDWSKKQLPPCRAKLHLTQSDNNLLLMALIYPAEYEQEIGQWIGDSGFCGSGPVDAGASQVQKYYQAEYHILEKHQLWPIKSIQAREREELLACVGQTWQR